MWPCYLCSCKESNTSLIRPFCMYVSLIERQLSILSPNLTISLNMNRHLARGFTSDSKQNKLQSWHRLDCRILMLLRVMSIEFLDMVRMPFQTILIRNTRTDSNTFTLAVDLVCIFFHLHPPRFFLVLLLLSFLYPSSPRCTHGGSCGPFFSR